MGGAALDGRPGWVTLLRAPNPGPMTLDGTNTWVLRAPGEELGFVIDPGPLDEGHLRAIAEHAPFRAILITHGHFDHVEGAPRLSEMLGGTPVLTSFDSDIASDGFRIRVLDTPGHTADSVCFLAESGNSPAMFTGDTVLGRGSTVVAAPDGDLGAYLRSLELLRTHPEVPMLPGHGPAQPDVAVMAQFYLDHRRERLAQVEAALEQGADTPEKVVDLVYPDIDPAVRFAAIFSAKAQLDYLSLQSDKGRWRGGRMGSHKNRESGTRADGLDRL